MKNKHFTFDERVFIQECLDQAISIHRIAKHVDSLFCMHLYDFSVLNATILSIK